MRILLPALRVNTSGASSQGRRCKETDGRCLGKAERASHGIAGVGPATPKGERPSAGMKCLEKATKENPEDHSIINGSYGRLYLELNETDLAANTIRSNSQTRNNTDTEVLEILVKPFYTTGKKKTSYSIGESKILLPVIRMTWNSRLKLWQNFWDAGHLAEAEANAREALFVDVMNAEAREILLEVLHTQKKDKEAEKIEGRYKQ